jgi:hypothetical protein
MSGVTETVVNIGISLSILLIAIGAILAWPSTQQCRASTGHRRGHRPRDLARLLVGLGGFGHRDASAGSGGQNTTIVERDRGY